MMGFGSGIVLSLSIITIFWIFIVILVNAGREN
jgi:hypothetical protein